MKDYDRKMREKWTYSEDERMQRKISRELSRRKKSFRERGDKDEQEADAIQRLLELKIKFESR